MKPLDEKEPVNNVIKAAQIYRRECENPAPDYGYRRLLREALFACLSKYESMRQEKKARNK